MIHQILDSFCHCKILVMGDLILDHYAFGTVNRISPEAPIQILDLDIEKEEFRLGGAANVAKNIAILGAQVSMGGLIGDDENGKILCSRLEDVRIRHEAVFMDTSRPTTVKTRFISQGHHQLLRADRERRHAMSERLCARFFDFVSRQIENFDAIILSDYAKGMLVDKFCEQVVDLCKKHNKRVFIGPKGKEWKRYSGASLLSANRSETQAVTGNALSNQQDIAEAGQKLLHQLQLEAMLITLGADGMYLTTRDSGECYVKAEAREVFDVAGAGDTVLALASLVVTAGHSWKTAIRIANTAAGIKVGKVGVATVSREELEKKFSTNIVPLYAKVKNIEELCHCLDEARADEKTIVFAFGTFSFLTPAMIRYMEYCKNKGDTLVVGVYAQNRSSANESAEMVSALSSVDYVVLLEEEIPTSLSKKIKPDHVVIDSSQWEKSCNIRQIGEELGFSVQCYPVSG